MVSIKKGNEMTPDERDILIETRNDVRWLKSFCEEHKKIHDNYLYYLVVTAIAALISLYGSFFK